MWGSGFVAPVLFEVTLTKLMENIQRRLAPLTLPAISKAIEETANLKLF